MSDDLVKRARGVLSGVTPGPWRLRPDDEEDEPAQCIRARGFDIATCWGGYIAGDSDARFIAAARELVPAMADRIEELETKLAAHDAEVYRRGQEDMRDRAGEVVRDKWASTSAEHEAAILALAIKEKDDE